MDVCVLSYIDEYLEECRGLGGWAIDPPYVQSLRESGRKSAQVRNVRQEVV